MQNKKYNKARVSIFVPLVCVVAGFVFSWWPLAVLGVIIAALYGKWSLALTLGLLLDLLYGAPLGMTHWLLFPFTLLVLMSLAVRAFLVSYLRKAAPVTL